MSVFLRAVPIIFERTENLLRVSTVCKEHMGLGSRTSLALSAKAKTIVTRATFLPFGFRARAFSRIHTIGLRRRYDSYWVQKAKFTESVESMLRGKSSMLCTGSNLLMGVFHRPPQFSKGLLPIERRQVKLAKCLLSYSLMCILGQRGPSTRTFVELELRWDEA